MANIYIDVESLHITTPIDQIDEAVSAATSFYLKRRTTNQIIVVGSGYVDLDKWNKRSDVTYLRSAGNDDGKSFISNSVEIGDIVVTDDQIFSEELLKKGAQVRQFNNRSVALAPVVLQGIVASGHLQAMNA